MNGISNANRKFGVSAIDLFQVKWQGSQAGHLRPAFLRHGDCITGAG